MFCPALTNVPEALIPFSIVSVYRVKKGAKGEEAGIIIAPSLHNPGKTEGCQDLEHAERLGESIYPRNSC